MSRKTVLRTLTIEVESNVSVCDRCGALEDAKPLVIESRERQFGSQGIGYIVTSYRFETHKHITVEDSKSGGGTRFEMCGACGEQMRQDILGLVAGRRLA